METRDGETKDRETQDRERGETGFIQTGLRQTADKETRDRQRETSVCLAALSYWAGILFWVSKRLALAGLSRG